MRKALFAVVLVSASFAGGAVVNGPGLRWAQSLVLNRLGLDDEAEGRGDVGDAGPHAPAPTEKTTLRPTPSPPAAEVKAETPRAVAVVSETAQAPALKNEKAAPATAAPEVTGPSQEAGTAAVAASSPPHPVLPPAPDAALPPLEPPAPLTTSRDRDRQAIALAKADGDGQRARAAEDATVRLASLANPTGAETTAPNPNADAVPTAPGDWAEVRRSLRVLGVSRYGIDGETGGRVRFHCLIPLAGRRAVGQHFEAEGDDEIQAARAALRRVALWRATEADAPAP